MTVAVTGNREFFPTVLFSTGWLGKYRTIFLNLVVVVVGGKGWCNLTRYRFLGQ
jgi:hypothetical protein